ncbi:MAG: hypothetical protein HY287_05145 [Planctomycetes bacterium]|nr:hypothetical protein [Planctomycetota bacterium]MBI3833699.1 hypothetical protein [Planctomycetota bacterium]
MRCWIVILAVVMGRLAHAQNPAPSPSAPPAPQPPVILKPHEAVRRGNELLKHSDPKSALDQYEEAARSLPEAREISFDEGLAQHALGNQEQARISFEKSMLDPPDSLSDDALYSLGAIDHSEALAPNAEPKQKLGKLESAMEKYQEVLSHRPEHAAARDANQKAATYWRQIKQQMEQQKQQQQSQDKDQNKDDKQDNNQDQKQADNQKQDQKQDQQSKQQQQDNQSQPQQSDQSQNADQQQKDQQQQSAQVKKDEKKDQKESQETQAQKSDEKQPEDQKPSADQTAMITREQAERQLREMMQAMQDRNKLHREDAIAPPAPAKSKDW